MVRDVGMMGGRPEASQAGLSGDWRGIPAERIVSLPNTPAHARGGEGRWGWRREVKRPRALFVSKAFPVNLTESVHGVYKRMSIFIDALKEVASVEFLFYVPDTVDVSEPSRRRLETALSEHWDTPLTLRLCPRDDLSKTTRWTVYGAPALRLCRQLGYRDVSGERQVSAFAEALDGEPDFLFVHRLYCMCPVLLSRRVLPPIYLDLDDIEHRRFARDVSQPPTWPAKRLLYLQVPALLLGERRAIRRTRRTFVCSDADQEYLRRRLRLPNVESVPNAIEPPDAAQPLVREPTLMFLGSYSYQPNINAAEFVVSEVWPHVRAAVPDARLVIAGSRAERLPSYAADLPGVEYPGFVEDLAALYARSRVVCVPVLAGGGTRVKLVEAAAYGKPLVSTRVGAEGLDFRDGREILLRDGPDAFAKGCIDLLRSDELCERLGKAARSAALRLYDRSSIVASLAERIRADLGA
jgi:glycosyltransferase involved in cell wall biosynthesis